MADSPALLPPGDEPVTRLFAGKSPEVRIQTTGHQLGLNVTAWWVSRPVAGSTKKLKKQKGTGGARAGSAKSGTRVGGGRIFGPRPRNYHFKLNVKLKRLARKSAFSYQAKNDGILILEDLNFDAAKTKDFVALVSALKLDNEKILLILGSKNDNVYLSSRNLGRVKVVTADSVNTYDVLNAKKVVLAESSLEVIEKILN